VYSADGKLLFFCFGFIHTAQRADNFIIGLTNVSAEVTAPVLNGYTVCGQYPGAVAAGATVSLKCTNADLPPARYVIVQFPVTGYMNFCELDICVRGLIAGSVTLLLQN